MFDEVIFLFPLIQLARGGDQIISLVTGALGGCISTLNFFMIIKSDIGVVECCLVLLPDKEVLQLY
jgi:hypothetical protein